MVTELEAVPGTLPRTREEIACEEVNAKLKVVKLTTD
eukprot:CAMPEP_0175904032 /NCGR_PEP_ID=MMETSP0108-20121206/4253_1 /TAXON_ID=195067 ORGANISM="Goniomonas pacifica, Strain CCMP1869" /NCGR_SAMPLE_ID=MMETSP0108 /ASSEMBLY_ACC=CAM_ASM_000204 /LENGTH=36 /DNA_ID= /DNA_START= /DNA_END= /DNA_ORIENTATION=